MKTVTLKRELIHAGNLIVVNAQHPYQSGGVQRTLVPANPEANNVLLEDYVVKILSCVMSKLNGWSQIVAVSGWRPIQEQEEIYAQSLKENGKDFTEKYVALPGCSEHHTGLAIDLGLKQEKIDFIRPEFPYEGICQEFRQTALSYGFIERYPRDKEGITGISHEPWHFRYVGAPHAEIMEKYGFALEEYISFLKDHPYGIAPYLHGTKDMCISVSYLEADKTADTGFVIEDNVPYSVSGNNMDGFIITEWRQRDGGQ